MKEERPRQDETAEVEKNESFIYSLKELRPAGGVFGVTDLNFAIVQLLKPVLTARAVPRGAGAPVGNATGAAGTHPQCWHQH